jgi:hypothetical protein
VDPVTKQQCIGCGPQEEFYGCADIRINSAPFKSAAPMSTDLQPVFVSSPSSVIQFVNHMASPPRQTCPSNGFFVNKNEPNCTSFYSCASTGTRFAHASLFKCPANSQFITDVRRCVSFKSERFDTKMANQCTSGNGGARRGNNTHGMVVIDGNDKDFIEEKKNMLADLVEVLFFS